VLIVTRARPARQDCRIDRLFVEWVERESCIKPRVDPTPLPLWSRIWLAFALFFRVLFDGRRAAALKAASDAAPAAIGAGEPPVGEPAPAAVVKPRAEDGDSALILLSLLQAEGRFVDFVQQDIAAFGDAEVGAVARMVHAGCRKALAAHVRIESIRAEPEGQRVGIDAGYDANRVKLTGNVGRGGRLEGVLRHRGWQATEVHLPTVVDRAGTRVLCPAEVEL
jgi:hypothetical protein